MSNRLERGFHVVELVIIVAVLAAIGLVGYGVWQKNNKNGDSTANTTAVTNTTPEIKTEQDLDDAAASVEELSTAESETDMTSLEQELDSL